MVVVKEISGEITLDLRQSILNPHLTMEQCKFDRDEEATCFHLGAYSNNELVGVASFFLEDCPGLNGNNVCRLRQMGVLPSWQGKGVGRAIIQHALMKLKEKECTLLWCQARKISFPFYEKVEFDYFGDFFDIPRSGLHKIMFRKI